MKSSTAATTRRKWRRWITRLKSEVSDLVISHEIYRGVVDVELSNEKIQQPRTFHTWMNRNYLFSCHVAIRRLTDPDKRSISFPRLLTDIAKNSNALTRRSFVQRYPNRIRHAGEITFDDLAGKGAAFLPPAVPKKDLKQVDRVGAAIRHYVNKRIAHLDQKNARPRIPRHRELKRAIQQFEALYSKYYLLLTSASQSTLSPSWLFDWKTVFHCPWIRDVDRKSSPVKAS